MQRAQGPKTRPLHTGPQWATRVIGGATGSEVSCALLLLPALPTHANLSPGWQMVMEPARQPLPSLWLATVHRVGSFASRFPSYRSLPPNAALLAALVVVTGGSCSIYMSRRCRMPPSVVGGQRKRIRIAHDLPDQLKSNLTVMMYGDHRVSRDFPEPPCSLAMPRGGALSAPRQPGGWAQLLQLRRHR